MESNWIDVKERLPETKKPVLCIDKNKQQYTAVYTKGSEIEVYNIDEETELLIAGWYELEEQRDSTYDECWMERIPTHWQPLPSPPEGNTKE